MRNEEVRELIESFRRRHDVKIDQLAKLFDSEGGFGIFDLASQVLGDPISAADWLTSSHFGLNGAVPAVAALDAHGREAVRTYLQQIEYCVYV